jgi:GNAT superfamily N-acetyltransferase
VTFAIRDYDSSDEDAVVALSLRSWAPVFASMEAVIGPEISRRLHGDDWTVYQAASVRESLHADGMKVWVAESRGAVVGFVTARVADADRRIGEIEKVAVDPAAQNSGLGSDLTELATDWLREVGMSVAAIGTGGDDGHAPARHVYEKAGYTPLVNVLYFKPL